MKHFLDSVWMRIRLIWFALTKRYFICSAYNSIDYKDSKVRSAGFIEHLPKSVHDRNIFCSVTIDTIKEISDETN